MLYSFATILAVAIGLFAAPVCGQELSAQDRAALEARKEALFQRMLRDPANLDVSFAYADVSARLGDNEAAVSALERMLLFNPNLPRVDLELGALYFRMGSFEVAQSYFDKAAAANPPPEVQARINQYRAQIASEANAGKVTGFLFMGGQYQSDANVAPGSGLIASPFFPFLLQLNNQFKKAEDGNLFLTGSVLYTYDLGTQNRDQIEVTGTGFVDHFFKFGRLDLDLGEVTAGPRLRFPDPAIPYVAEVTVKPYGILNEVGLGENQYFDTYGAGLESTAIVFQDLGVRTSFEFRQKSFSNAPDRPLSTGLNGNDKLVTIALTKPLAIPFSIPGLTNLDSTLNVEFDFLDQSTRFAFYSNKSYAGYVGYRLRYDDPTGIVRLPWETTIYGSRTYANYAQPDPCCNTSPNPLTPGSSDRYDRRWRFGITQSFSVADRIAIVVQAQRDIVSSNLSLYGYTSNSILIGPQLRF